MTPETFIEKAIEGGWKDDIPKFWKIETIVIHYENNANFWLNPKVWQAVGKATKKAQYDNEMGYKVWATLNMRCMVNALAEASQKPNFSVSKTIEAYLKTL